MILTNYGIVSSSGMSTSTLNESLFAVYKAESNANDSLGNYSGTPYGGLTYTTGKSGNAFVGNGTDAYVSLPNDSYNSLTGDFSISLWVNIVNTGGVQQALFTNFAYAGTAFYGFAISNLGYTKFQIFDGSATPVTLQEPSANPYGAWQHIVCTRKTGSASKIYFNASLSASNASTVNPVYTTGNMRPSIAAQSYGPLFSNLVQYYAGNGTKIDEVNIWNKELTSTEVTELYNSASGKFYPY
jgi:hypothetical protein